MVSRKINYGYTQGSHLQKSRSTKRQINQVCRQYLYLHTHLSGKALHTGPYTEKNQLCSISHTEKIIIITHLKASVQSTLFTYLYFSKKKIVENFQKIFQYLLKYKIGLKKGLLSLYMLISTTQENFYAPIPEIWQIIRIMVNGQYQLQQCHRRHL